MQPNPVKVALAAGGTSYGTMAFRHQANISAYGKI